MRGCRPCVPFRDCADVRQLGVGIQEALVAAGDIVVDLDAEDVALGGIAHDLAGDPAAET